MAGGEGEGRWEGGGRRVKAVMGESVLGDSDVNDRGFGAVFRRNCGIVADRVDCGFLNVGV